MNIKKVKIIHNLNGYFCEFNHQENERKWYSIYEIDEIRMAKIFNVMAWMNINYPEYVTKPNWTKVTSYVCCSIYVIKE